MEIVLCAELQAVHVNYWWNNIHVQASAARHV